MSEIDFWGHFCPVQKSGTGFLKILLPFNSILFCQKNPVHVKIEPHLRTEE
jgi:hypothetical protein